jgi:hypothetical protein
VKVMVEHSCDCSAEPHWAAHLGAYSRMQAEYGQLLSTISPSWKLVVVLLNCLVLSFVCTYAGDL